MSKGLELTITYAALEREPKLGFDRTAMLYALLRILKRAGFPVYIVNNEIRPEVGTLYWCVDLATQNRLFRWSEE